MPLAVGAVLVSVFALSAGAYYTSPLLILLFSARLTGDRVGPGTLGAAATAAGLLLPISETLESANPFLFGAWATLDGREVMAIAALALAMLIGSVGAAVAYQIGPAPVVATFDYAYLVFAALWGVLLFAEIPDIVTLIGMGMIVVGGILAVRSGSDRTEPVRT